MRALVTGGTGFLGSHLLDLLRAQGAEVSVLVRPGAPADSLPDGVGRRVGDVRDGAALEAALAGADVVFHLAAVTAPWGPRARYLDINVGGTGAVADACRSAAVGRLVYVSSMVVLGVECDRRGLAEDAPYATAFASPYEESKVRAEQLVRERARATGLPVAVVRPGMGWGPRERTMLPAMVRALRSPFFFMVGNGRNTLDLSYAGNVAEGLWLAATRPEAAGRVYNLADGFGITCREYLGALAGALGLPVPRRRLPRGLVQFLMRVVFPPQPEPAETLHRPSHEALLRLCALFRDSEPDTRRIRSELGFSPPVDFAAGIAATAAWYRKAHPEDPA